MESKNEQEREQFKMNKIKLEMFEVNKRNSDLEHESFDCNKEIMEVIENRRMEIIAYVEVKN